MAKGNILVVEDEEDILELVAYNLMKEGYEVARAATGEMALEYARSRTPDLVILDLMLPGIDGIEVCRALKAERATADIPVIMLTAKGEEVDIVAGLELGADDYIPKPFSPRVLLARVKVIFRRRAPRPTVDMNVLRVGRFLINPGRHEVLIDGKAVELTLTEFRVLQVLASRPGWVFSRVQIVEAVRGDGYPVTDRSVDVQIVGLRRKLGTLGKAVETVRGVGYRFRE